LSGLVELLGELAGRQKQLGWVAELCEVSVAGDDDVDAGGQREREQVWAPGLRWPGAALGLMFFTPAGAFAVPLFPIWTLAASIALLRRERGAHRPSGVAVGETA